MNRNILRSIIGIVALTAMGTSNAAISTLTTTPNGPALSYGDIGLVPTTYVPPTGTTFYDDFYFSLPKASKLDSNVTSIDLAGFGFGPLNAELIDTSVSSTDVVGTGLNFSLASLAAGNYELVVSGTAESPFGGIFGGAVHVSAVPIPAAGWLLLSGLVGLGAIARRRKSEI